MQKIMLLHLFYVVIFYPTHIVLLRFMINQRGRVSKINANKTILSELTAANTIAILHATIIYNKY